jgi:hypothetical protein
MPIPSRYAEADAQKFSVGGENRPKADPEVIPRSEQFEVRPYVLVTRVFDCHCDTYYGIGMAIDNTFRD